MSKVKPPVKLTAERARLIRELFAAGESMYALAQQFNVSTTTIKDVVTFETWGRAGGPRPPDQKSCT